MKSVKNYLDYQISELLSQAYVDYELNNTLKDYSACIWFQEPSTRTLMSFDRASQDLGIKTTILPFNNSQEKGETVIDTAKNISWLGYDFLIMRTDQNNLPDIIQSKVSSKVINAGDGTNEHPTQAFADLYTIINEFDDFYQTDIAGLKVAFIGDILRSRVAHSLIPLLQTYNVNVRILPQTVISDNELMLTRLDHIQQAVNWADFVYMLRTKNEYFTKIQKVDVNTYASVFHTDAYQFKAEYLDSVKLMHPGPVLWGNEISKDVGHHKNNLIADQVHNGVKVRKSILYCEVKGYNTFDY